MKKSTKFVSLLLAVMLTVSTFAGIAVFPVSAGEGGEQRVYFRFPDESVWTHEGLKNNARSGKANVYCYAYAIYGNSKPYSLGWKTRTTQCNFVVDDPTLYYFDLNSIADKGPIEDGADYGIIFSTAAAGQNQTCDVNLTTECIGHTVIVTPFNGVVDRENAADSKKRDHYATWDGMPEPYGPKATISSLGKLMPGYFPKNQPRAQQLSNALKQYLTNPTNNPYFQYENNMQLCADLGTNAQDVYNQYLADNKDNITGEPETDESVPCPFYRYMYINDQEKEVEGKLAAPEYVREVLGISDEEPTTEAPTTVKPDEPISTVTVTANATINVGSEVPGSQKFSYPDAGYGISNLSFSDYGTDFEYGAEYQLTFMVEANEGYVLTEDTEVNLVVGDDSVAPYSMDKEFNQDGTITAHFFFKMPEAPTTVEPTTEPVVTEEPTTEPVATEEPTTEPVAASTYTVAGSSAAIFNGTAWDASNEANDMTFNEATGLYEITYPNVQPEDAIQLKVVKDHGWDESYPEQNVSFNVKTACDVKVTYNPETNEVKVEGEGVTFEDDLKPYSIIAVGNGEDTYLNGANWDPCDPANAMTEVADGIWEMTMEDIYAFDNYQVKFAVNSVDEEGNPTSNPWAHNFGSEEETQYPVNTELDAFYNGKNCIFEVEEDASTVKLQLDLRNFDFKTMTGAKMTITVTAPEPEPTVEPTTEPVVTEEPTTEPVATEEPTTEPVAASTYTVAGSSAAIFNGTAWDASNEANDMTFNEATGLYEITYPNVQPEDAIQLKVVKDHGWDESYPEQNVSFNVKTACDVKVTYNPETNEVKVEGEGVTFEDDLKPYSIIAVGNGEDTYLNGANWDPCDPANAMTEVADGIWEMTMEDIYAFDNYQVKFAVNSVDEEGNPTSNPWAHNFGSEEETQYPVNTELDAFYNGKNCIFEVEEDESTVKLQLDLRNFDFKTMTGAKMTITVTAPEPQAEGTIGDVNKDGQVDAIDAMLIQQVAIGKTPNSIFSNKLADVNNDGIINVLDASCVQRYAAGMTKKTGNAGVAYEDITPVSDDPQIME